MTKLIGRQESVGIGKESARGTAVAATYWIPWEDLKIDDMVNTVLNETSLARMESSDGMAVTQKWGEIEIGSKMKDKSMGLFLLSLFGTDTPAVNADGSGLVYDHVYSINQTTQHQSLTVSHKSSNDAVGYANAVVDSLKISAKYGDYVRFNTKLLSVPSAALANTVAHSAENDFVAQNLVFKKASAQSGLTGASAVKIREFSLEFSANVSQEWVLGNVAPNDILNGAFDIKGSVTIVHNDATYADMQNNETYNAMRFDIINTGVTIGTSANPKLRIDLHRVRVTNYERKMKLNDLIEETFDITAHYSLTDSKMITATLTNLVASY